MQCPICHNSGRPMYCGHCMNTSPNLLVKLRIDLFILRGINCKLKRQVESILDYGLNFVEGRVNHCQKSEFNGESRNIEGEILGKRLQHLDYLRLKKKNNRIKYRISQEHSTISEKKQRKDLLLKELQAYSKRRYQDSQISTLQDEVVLVDKKQQIEQVQKVVLNTQLLKLKGLMDWLVLRKRDSYEFPYSLAFQPVVSLKNFYKLPSMVAWNSLIKMSQYVTLISDILLFDLPCKVEESQSIVLLQSEDTEEPIEENNVAEFVTRLVINILQISRHRNLISQDPLDLAWLLDQYDLDAIFYNMITGQEMKTRPVSHHWTYTRVLRVVSGALQLSIYAASPGSRPTLTDKWFLVG